MAEGRTSANESSRSNSLDHSCQPRTSRRTSFAALASAIRRDHRRLTAVGRLAIAGRLFTTNASQLRSSYLVLISVTVHYNPHCVHRSLCRRFCGQEIRAARTSLASLLAATLFLDLLWPWFLLFGWERVRIDPGNTRFTPLDLAYYPWSHRLLMSVVWAAAFAVIYHRVARYWPGTLAIWIGVVSHWVLDCHRFGPLAWTM